MDMFVYTLVPGKIKALLAKIREVTVPTKKITIKWLESVGFTSTNDRTLLPVLSFLGFIDASNVPAATWKEYRGPEPGKVLARAIKESYSELYDTYPDAHARDLKDVEAIVKSKTTVGQDLVSRMTNTFKSLCAEADFSGLEEETPKQKPLAPDPHAKGPDHDKPGAPAGKGSFPSLHIDIQVHITPDTSPDQIDKIFESIARHLPPSKT
jgi:hypothetical protein